MLQEAVDALFDNGRRGSVIRAPNKRPLETLADMRKGKQGRSAETCSGKRVDSSGRSLLVWSRDEAAQCGLTQEDGARAVQAVIYERVEAKGFRPPSSNPRSLSKREARDVWGYLEEVIRDSGMLNRARRSSYRHSGVRAGADRGQGRSSSIRWSAPRSRRFDGDQMEVCTCAVARSTD